MKTFTSTHTPLNDFFLGGGGGKNVDMPSDCQNLGGHRHSHPIETKSWGGNCPPLPPPRLPRPCITLCLENIHKHAHTPLGIVRVTSSALRAPVTHTLHRFSGSGQVQGGGVITPVTHPPDPPHPSSPSYQDSVPSGI